MDEQIKCFGADTIDFHKLEDLVNDWLNRHQGIRITGRTQSGDSATTHMTIWYKKN